MLGVPLQTKSNSGAVSKLHELEVQCQNTSPFWIVFTHLYTVCLPSHSAVLEGSLPTRHQSHLLRAPDAKENQVMRVNLSSHVKTLIISIWKNSFATLALESHVVSSAHICTLCLSKLCGGLNPLELW